MQNTSGTNKQNVELVFRTVGERTSDQALLLAKKHIQPSKVHVIENVRPFSQTVVKMLQIEHDCSHVVYVDADCLMLEDLRPFLNYNQLPFVDCYVRDSFRGRVNCGVHIVRRDVIEEMKKVHLTADDPEYLLRPESYLRNQALHRLGLTVQYKNFNILHDYLQSYEDIFAKYVLREIRSRNKRRQPLETLAKDWDSKKMDFLVAKAGIEYAAHHITENMKYADLKIFLEKLPTLAKNEVKEMTLEKQTEIAEQDIEAAYVESKKHLPVVLNDQKVFGIGLSRTGTHSLTVALHILGYDTVHNPIDQETGDTLERGDANFPLLNFYNGITDVTTVPLYKKLDRLYPNSKFVLTVRDEESWLESCKKHWDKLEPKDTTGYRLSIRKKLRQHVYKTQQFDKDTFRKTYQNHIDDVTHYFKDRPHDLLALNIVKGEGYEKLAPFLDQPIPKQKFPYLGRSKEK